LEPEEKVWQQVIDYGKSQSVNEEKAKGQHRHQRDSGMALPAIDCKSDPAQQRRDQNRLLYQQVDQEGKHSRFPYGDSITI
jgi:hypothetical protein